VAGQSTGPPRRPYVWVNCAASVDGRLAYAHGARARLSGPEDLERVHQLRAASDAILVGVGTVVLDDPSLRVREEFVKEPPKRPPARVVVDASGRTPEGARVLDGSIPTVLATTEGNSRRYPSHVQVVRAGQGSVDLARLFGILRDRGIERLMVEGGSRILAAVARERLFDRWTVYYAPVLIGSSSAPTMLSGGDPPGGDDTVHFRLVSLDRLGEGYVATYAPRSTAPGDAPAQPPPR
jgi:2,5-diamino-6-(ribosylamino)-4(3H)-pyrimidinone 5'-phosphate reductase